MFWAYVGVKTYEGFIQLQRIFVRRQWALARGLLWVVFASLVFSLLPEESVRVVEQYQLAADWWRDPELSYKAYYWQLPVEKFGDQLRVIDYLKTIPSLRMRSTFGEPRPSSISCRSGKTPAGLFPTWA